MPILDEQIDLLEKHAISGGGFQSPRSDLDEIVAAELSVFRQIAQSRNCYRTTEPYREEVECRTSTSARWRTRRRLPQALQAAAATHRPPQEWYEQTDCPFTPEPPVNRVRLPRVGRPK
jgi:hypothetical protein